MSITPIKLAIIFAFTAITPAMSFAGDIKGKFSFAKKPPSVGLVYMSEDHSLKANPLVDQKGKEFTEKLYVGAKGAEMTFKNSDEVSHNIFAQDSEAGVNFDVGLMPVGSEQKKAIDWKEGKVVKISCKIHPNMRSYVANVDSKYHTVLEIPKKKSFSFELKGVPDDLSEVAFWFSSSFDELKLQVKKGETKEIPFTKRGKKYGTLTLTHE